MHCSTQCRQVLVSDQFVIGHEIDEARPGKTKWVGFSYFETRQFRRLAIVLIDSRQAGGSRPTPAGISGSGKVELP
jgi:hypothetical protein